jgi:hypothetical protein
MMKKKKVFCSMIDIEREYYPNTFLERKKKVKAETAEQTGINLAQLAIKEVRDEFEKLESVH